MLPFLSKAAPAIQLLAAFVVLTGCASAPAPAKTLVPDYIGSACVEADRSRIVTPKELYAVCLNEQWVLVNGDQFGIYKVLLDNPVKRPDMVMQRPGQSLHPHSGDLCITVSESEVGWADVEYEGSVMRFPLVDGSCSLSPCGISPKAYQPGICQ